MEASKSVFIRNIFVLGTVIEVLVLAKQVGDVRSHGCPFHLWRTKARERCALEGNETRTPKNSNLRLEEGQHKSEQINDRLGGNPMKSSIFFPHPDTSFLLKVNWEPSTLAYGSLMDQFRLIKRDFICRCFYLEWFTHLLFKSCHIPFLLSSMACILFGTLIISLLSCKTPVSSSLSFQLSSWLQERVGGKWGKGNGVKTEQCQEMEWEVIFKNNNFTSPNPQQTIMGHA